MRRRGLALALICWTAGSVAGCRSCDRDAAKTTPSAMASVAVAAPPPRPPVAAPHWREIDSTRGFGLPGSCRIELPIRSAPLPTPEARFVAAPTALSSLLLAAGKDDEVTARGLVDLTAGRVIDLPWLSLDNPPLVDRAENGWVAAWAQSDETSLARAVLWRDGQLHGSVTGDHLKVADLRCSGGGCALLTSLARASEAPGATLAFVAGATGSVDIEAGGAFAPLGIVDAAPLAGRARVALSDGSGVAIWKVEGGKASSVAQVPTPHGVYDVTHAGAPLVVAPGAPETSPCVDGGFPVEIKTLGGGSERVASNAPPDGVIARALDGGAIIAWIGPASCRFATRRLVHAVVVDAKGKALSSPMAVTEARGFALSAKGRKLSLWLAKDDQLVWITATCPAP